MTDPYLDPATGILTNLLGCTTAEELERVEAAHATLRDVELLADPLPGMFDLAHLKRIHAYLFGDVYGWAGQLRTVNIHKGVPFASVEYIESEARHVFSALAKAKYLRGRDTDGFAVAAADLLGNINALHPFREGNGRTQRAFLRQLGLEAGYIIDWTQVDPADNVRCSLESLCGRDEPLRDLLRRIVSPGVTPVD